MIGNTLKIAATTEEAGKHVLFERAAPFVSFLLDLLLLLVQVIGFLGDGHDSLVAILLGSIAKRALHITMLHVTMSGRRCSNRYQDIIQLCMLCEAMHAYV